MKKKWIKDAIGNPWALREQLKVKAWKTIPKTTLEEATKKWGKLGARARLAETLSKLRKKK